MARYLCLQRSLPSTARADAPKPSPSPMQDMYARFGAWTPKFEDNLVDMGGRLGEGKVVAVADGPFTEVKELVGGYMIVEADSLEQAIEVASGCPGLVRPGSGVEVIEIYVPG